MATKHTDGCFQKAEDDEPLFTLLARDPMASVLVQIWATSCEAMGQPEHRSEEANKVAEAMDAWRAKNRPNRPDVDFDELDGILHEFRKRYL